MPDKSSKTEQPTQRRLQKAREEGQYPNAREFVSALQFMVFLGLVGWGGARWLAQFRQMARMLLTAAFARELRTEDFLSMGRQLLWRNFLPLVAGGSAVAAATLLFRLLTTRFGLSLKKLTPDVSRLNPIARLRELPRQNLPSLFQAIVLLPVFLWAVWAIARDRLDAFLALPLGSVESGCGFLIATLMGLSWKAAVVFLGFGA